jgi:hypothetical protein
LIAFRKIRMLKMWAQKEKVSLPHRLLTGCDLAYKDLFGYPWISKKKAARRKPTVVGKRQYVVRGLKRRATIKRDPDFLASVYGDPLADPNRHLVPNRVEYKGASIGG